MGPSGSQPFPQTRPLVWVSKSLGFPPSPSLREGHTDPRGTLLAHQKVVELIFRQVSLPHISVGFNISTARRNHRRALTQPTGADVLDAGLPAGAEAFVGGIVRAIGKECFRGHEAIGGHTLKLPRLLIHQCHGSGRVSVEKDQG